MVYDLGGVTHFAKENQFPVAWTPEQSALLLDTCYSPELWDVYWTRSPCSFVMGRLQEEKLFGTSAISSAWIAAITHHPLAYLQHRADVFWTFLAGDNMVMWTVDIEDQARPLFPGRARFAAVVAMNDALRTTPLCRIGSWLTACLLFCALAWRRRGTPEGAFVIGVCGSAAIYVLTFAVVGVAADFRYGLWAVIAALSAPPVLLTASSAGAAEKV